MQSGDYPALFARIARITPPQSSSAFRLPRKQDHLFLDIETWELPWPIRMSEITHFRVSMMYEVRRPVSPQYVAHIFLSFSLWDGSHSRLAQVKIETTIPSVLICQPERISRCSIPSLHKRKEENREIKKYTIDPHPVESLLPTYATCDWLR